MIKSIERRQHSRLALLLNLASATAGAATAPMPPPAFTATIQPFVQEYCIHCHNARRLKGDLNLETYLAARAAHFLAERPTWEKVLDKLDGGEMPPPEEEKQPSDDEIAAVTSWLQSRFSIADRDTPPDPGHTTVRRLNRSEYDHTVRDLLGLDFRFTEDFPADNVGYGFTNIGDVLSLSPVLMEKYLEAAERISRLAIPTGDPVPDLAVRYEAEASGQQNRAHIETLHDFPVDGTYNLRTAWEQGLPNNFKMTVRFYLDGKRVLDLPLTLGVLSDRAREVKGIAVSQGTHKIEAEILVPPPAPGARKSPYPYPVRIEVDGPFQQATREQSASYRRLFQLEGAPPGARPKSAREILAPIVREAYRRPITRHDLNPLLDLVKLVQANGGSFADGIRIALQAILVSPNFLFRLEQDPASAASHRVSDLELASRLSYFLWSSQPNRELLSVAEKGRLHETEVLHAQVRRMMADPKARSLAEDFSEQWLQTRNLETMRPDSRLFPDYDLELRDDMLTESTMFFQAIVAENRSILDLLDGRFTFVNERLARHYGIPGIQGREFRRVELDGVQRSGVLTQAAVLTVSSYPTRTSPVLRGKWVLENLLNTPPPLPPANVPALNADHVGETATLRERLEQHRSDPACAACHLRMDPLGFGLENYDAIGRWRTSDGKIALNTSGRLPNGKTFADSEQMKEIFRADASKFTRAFTEKLLTYALGRGPEYYDKPAVETIARHVEQNGYRFSELVLAIVDSVPFQMRHRETADAAKSDNPKESP